MYEFVEFHLPDHELSFPVGLEDITIASIDSEPINELEKVKGTALHYFRSYELDKSLDSDFYITFLMYTQLNNDMNAAGFFITQDNREKNI